MLLFLLYFTLRLVTHTYTYSVWQILVRKEIAIAEALKSTRLFGDFVQLEAWCPTEDVERVSKDFMSLMDAAGLKGI